VGQRRKRDNALRRVVGLRAGPVRAREWYDHNRSRLRSVRKRHLLDDGEYGLLRLVEHLRAWLLRNLNRVGHRRSRVICLCRGFV
jgi:hypothetical protein